MKRKTFAALSSAVVAAALLLFAGCGIFGKVLPDESFPYDFAVQGGYEGTEGEWLTGAETPSTHERRLYEELVAAGEFEGSFSEFLKEYGVDTDDTAAVNAALASVVQIETSTRLSSTTVEIGSGSGVIYSLDTATGNALIVTNHHVVYSNRAQKLSETVTLYLYGGKTAGRAIKAEYVGGSAAHDIAVLSVRESPLLKETETNRVEARAAVFADSDSITVGERVYAVGNAAGYGISVTKGCLSVDAEYIRVNGDTAGESEGGNILLVMRTDAPVNHGNSGGALVNGNGEVVGIVSARSEREGIVGFGYAIPSSLAVSLAKNILENTPSRGALLADAGFETAVADTRAVYDEQAGKYHISEKVVAKSVSESWGLAREAGLRNNDTIVAARIVRGGETVREIAVTRKYMLDILLVDLRAGDSLELGVTRTGTEGIAKIVMNFAGANFKSYT